MLLREQNKLMSAGLITHAAPLSNKIGACISKHNSGLLKGAAFTGVEGRSDTACIWRLVKEVTGKTLSTYESPSHSLTAEIINAHYTLRFPLT